MDFQTSVKTCLTQKYARFSGRASRSEYWWFVLASVILLVLASLLAPILYLIVFLGLIVPLAAAGYRRLQDTGRPGWYIFIPVGLGLLGMLLNMLLMPAMPTMVDGQMTEMPDMSNMGGMGLLAILSIVQLVVSLVFLWWLTRPSQPEANAYGPPPVV
ncbi:DUF805 domain-containing protein [Thalassorhabdomicrobium marinisediminis]|uniref:DUF805 domain-containing protein n=1 Tax=Thalassorhabdomicrobium marinisediminis TaxID=2170577 RepID=A0A2T7FWH6_9RHOB|nr:DUF805 domain-containing protein [Thalassorhabdomicrobium marinisediminis]PVA06523.1 DUF805 domain-containing protein [Thalassorhabdomicrobium marinisediminis]